VDTDSILFRGILTASVLVAASLVVAIGRHTARRLIDESEQRYNAARLLRVVVWIVVAVGLVFVWRPLGGNLGPALGLATAGLAFAMQEVVGAVAGWFNITFGRVFRIGDRVQMAGVHGDVIDISLLKTRLMEIGSAGSGSWVEGRQYTGRVVAISNKATFTEPVFNYSSYFDYIWEETVVGVPHHEDWQRAAAILEEEARRVSASDGARQAMDEVRRRFPVPAAEVIPRVFAAADEAYVRLAVRFVVPIRTARQVKDELTRASHRRLEQAGIEVVSPDVIQQAAGLWSPVEPAEDGAEG
jgi:small-conductance mechanosensitive channel